MGRPKHLLQDKAGRPLWSLQRERFKPYFHAHHLLAGDFTLPAPTPILKDPPGLVGEGPLSALLALLRHSTTPWVALLAVDQVGVVPELYRLARSQAGPEVQAVVYRDQQGRQQWLCGLYQATVTPLLESALKDQVRAFWRFAARLSIREVSPPAGSEGWFTNVNTPAEAARAGLFLPPTNERNY